MVTLTGYGGVEEIGGNKFLLEDDDRRFLLDFGTAFGRRQKFFNEYLRPRAARGLFDLLSLDLLPPLEGLYREDLAPLGMWERFRGTPFYRDLRRGNAPAVDAIFISHAHLDHNGDLAFLDPQIPVCCTCATAFVARAMQVAGSSDFEHETSFIRVRDKAGETLLSSRNIPCQVRAYLMLDGPLSDPAVQWWARTLPSSKEIIHRLPSGFSGTIAGREVRWWWVDHSVPGAAAFAIHTSAGWVAYSGDLRFHGRLGTEMERVIQEMAALKPIALLCEGTHLEPGPPVSEAEVAFAAAELIQEAAGRLVVADFAPRNIERLQTFLCLAEDAGRQLLIQPKDALLLEALSLADPASISLSSSHLALYADPKSAPRSWEKRVRQDWAGRTVTPAQVSQTPGDYILCFSLWDANDLLDLEKAAGGLYLYSNSRAYDEEQAIDLERLRNWIRQIGLQMEGDPDQPNARPLHSSGHASGDQLLDFVRRVHPATLIPIHTEQPKQWKNRLRGSDISVTCPKMGRPIHL